MGKIPTNSLGKSSELKLHCFCLYNAYNIPIDTYSAYLSYIQQTCRDENIPRSMPSEGINPEFFYFGKIVWLYNSILLNALQFIPNFTR